VNRASRRQAVEPRRTAEQNSRRFTGRCTGRRIGAFSLPSSGDGLGISRAFDAGEKPGGSGGAETGP
jgi:hypothetical protein